MKDIFERLYELQRKNPIYSEWAKTTRLKERVLQIREEIDEALEELEKGNNKEFAEEMGDVLWDCIGAMAKAEHEGILDVKEVLLKTEEKYKERKPFLVKEQWVSREEEEKVWYEVKAKQKARKNERT